MKQPPNAPKEHPIARQAFWVPIEQTHEQQRPVKGFQEAEGQAVSMGKKKKKQKGRKGISFESKEESKEKSLQKTKVQQSHEVKLRLAAVAGGRQIRQKVTSPSPQPL